MMHLNSAIEVSKEATKYQLTWRRFKTLTWHKLFRNTRNQCLKAHWNLNTPPQRQIWSPLTLLWSQISHRSMWSYLIRAAKLLWVSTSPRSQSRIKTSSWSSLRIWPLATFRSAKSSWIRQSRSDYKETHWTIPYSTCRLTTRFIN